MFISNYLIQFPDSHIGFMHVRYISPFKIRRILVCSYGNLTKMHSGKKPSVTNCSKLSKKQATLAVLGINYWLEAFQISAKLGIIVRL